MVEGFWVLYCFAGVIGAHETINCSLPYYDGEHINRGMVCQWTPDNFERYTLITKNYEGYRVIEKVWLLKRDYDKDNYVEKIVRKAYWKRKDKIYEQADNFGKNVSKRKYIQKKRKR